jgi:hypothetical protein
LLVPAVATARIAKARVWVSVESPLIVRGSGFRAHEHVTVKVSVSGERFTRAVTASGVGSFVARWAGSAGGSGGCVSVFVRAVGDRGSTAVWQSVANDCANGPTS